jgi:hypothetical protein
MYVTLEGSLCCKILFTILADSHVRMHSRGNTPTTAILHFGYFFCQKLSGFNDGVGS